MTSAPPPVWRSLLFVPVTAQRFVDGAARRRADAIILDLEDSVAASEKERARTLVNGVDHLVPGSVLGVAGYHISRDNTENLVTCCWSCNGVKRNFDPRTSEPVTVANRADTTAKGWRNELIERVRGYLKKRDWSYYRPDYEKMKSEIGT